MATCATQVMRDYLLPQIDRSFTQNTSGSEDIEHCALVSDSSIECISEIDILESPASMFESTSSSEYSPSCVSNPVEHSNFAPCETILNLTGNTQEISKNIQDVPSNLPPQHIWTDPKSILQKYFENPLIFTRDQIDNSTCNLESLSSISSRRSVSEPSPSGGQLPEVQNTPCDVTLNQTVTSQKIHKNLQDIPINLELPRRFVKNDPTPILRQYLEKPINFSNDHMYLEYYILNVPNALDNISSQNMFPHMPKITKPGDIRKQIPIVDHFAYKEMLYGLYCQSKFDINSFKYGLNQPIIQRDTVQRQVANFNNSSTRECMTNEDINVFGYQQQNSDASTRSRSCGFINNLTKFKNNSYDHEQEMCPPYNSQYIKQENPGEFQYPPQVSPNDVEECSRNWSGILNQQQYFQHHGDMVNRILRRSTPFGLLHTSGGCIVTPKRKLSSVIPAESLPEESEPDPEFDVVTEYRRRQNQGSKRPRSSYPNEKLTMLEAEFCSTPYITRSRRVELAEHLNLDPKQIKIWFQNRRMKQKKKIPEQTRIDISEPLLTMRKGNDTVMHHENYHALPNEQTQSTNNTPTKNDTGMPINISNPFDISNNQSSCPQMSIPLAPHYRQPISPTSPVTNTPMPVYPAQSENLTKRASSTPIPAAPADYSMNGTSWQSGPSQEYGRSPPRGNAPNFTPSFSPFPFQNASPAYLGRSEHDVSSFPNRPGEIMPHMYQQLGRFGHQSYLDSVRGISGSSDFYRHYADNGYVIRASGDTQKHFRDPYTAMNTNPGNSCELNNYTSTNATNCSGNFDTHGRYFGSDNINSYTSPLSTFLPNDYTNSLCTNSSLSNLPNKSHNGANSSFQQGAAPTRPNEAKNMQENVDREEHNTNDEEDYSEEGSETFDDSFSSFNDLV